MQQNVKINTMQWRTKISSDIQFTGYQPKEDIKPEIEPKQELEISNEEYDSLTLNQKADYISNYLHQNTEFNDVQIAGIIACLINESALKRDAENQMEAKKWADEPHKSGKGIAQWSLGRNLNFAEWMQSNYGEELFPNEATINQQLEFMLYEMSQRDAFLHALSMATTPEEAADAVRRGFENGSSNSLASRKQMDSYIKVGSPGADEIYRKDAKQANWMYSRLNTIIMAKQGIKLLIK